MIIGVPRETHRHEHRAGLTPSAVGRLTRLGHSVVIERGVGGDAHFADRDYERAGAQIVYNREEAYRRAEVVCRVGLLDPEDLDLLRPGSTICAFHHLAVTPRETVKRLMELELTLVGYEVVADRDGSLPVLVPFSEMAGQMAVHTAAHLLQNEAGGRGILLGEVPGVPPPTVLVLGAGTVGTAAARQASAAGAHVIVVDAELRRLRRLSAAVPGVVTAVAGLDRLERFTAIADVVVGAVLVPGGRAPFLVTEDMVRAMKQGSVIIDVSIDQGGCVETSRPTTLGDPTFRVHGVTHYCVPNMTADIPRTASRALASAALPAVTLLAERGVDRALREEPGLARGAYLYRGALVHPRAAEALDLLLTPLEEALAAGGEAPS
ncbi:MAG: alanine dehydrogenase [Acidobacteriota bacterium]|jgi:alanine dehydrogenase